MIRRLCIFAAVLSVVIAANPVDRQGAAAYAADTYSLDDTATVVVLHPDTLDALAEQFSSVTATISAMPDSSISTSSVLPVRLDDRSMEDFLLLSSVAQLLIVASVGFLVTRSVVR